MVDDFVQAPVDGAGKKLQTFSNVVGANTVHAEAMTPVSSTGTELALATEATLGTVHGHVDSIDGKVTACNTGAVAGSVKIEDAVNAALKLDVNDVGAIKSRIYYYDVGWKLVGIPDGEPETVGPLPVNIVGFVDKRMWIEGPSTNVLEVDANKRIGVNTKNALTASAPTAVSVGVASGIVIAANANRKGLVLVNTSTAIISLNCVAGAAVLYSGITLNARGGVWVMDEYTFTTAEIRGIASAAASNLAVQEYT